MNLARWRTPCCLVAAPMLLALLVVLGCNSDDEKASRRGPVQTGTRGGLFESVVENLDHLEQFETDQILKQVCDRLNQWYQQERPPVAWELDPLIQQLPADLQAQPDIKRLEVVRFVDPDDGWYLQEAVWLREVSDGARADQFDDLAVARRLFDWTIRNVQLENDPAPGDKNQVLHRPFETLFFGRGTAAERAWLFILLARQQGLDVVFLETPGEDGALRPWLPALLVGDSLFLFDTRLGMPVPGPTPGSVATLEQVRQDESLLRKLDLDAEHLYPIRPADLEQVVANVEGSPPALSRRMALVESRLAGNRKLKLTSPGNELAQRVAKLPGISQAKLWPMPIEVYGAIARRTPQQTLAANKELVLYRVLPTLKLARALHFKGEYDGANGAKAKYLNSRPSDDYIENYHLPPEAAEHYSRENWGKIEAAQTLLLREAKQSASFWLGLVFLEQEDYQNAIDYLAVRSLGTERSTPWATSARYNLARAYEGASQTDKAIQMYESDKDGPQSHGNQLRARWLKEASQAEQGDASEPKKEAKEEPSDKDKPEQPIQAAEPENEPATPREPTTPEPGTAGPGTPEPGTPEPGTPGPGTPEPESTEPEPPKPE